MLITPTQADTSIKIMWIHTKWELVENTAD